MNIIVCMYNMYIHPCLETYNIDSIVSSSKFETKYEKHIQENMVAH
jgi:hypothetical protein